ncbi:MAG: hypothetical protein AAGE65_13630 [Planctomycetota bacterium]
MTGDHFETLNRAHERCVGVAAQLDGMARAFQAQEVPDLAASIRELRAEVLAVDAEVREVRDANKITEDAR